MGVYQQAIILSTHEIGLSTLETTLLFSFNMCTVTYIRFTVTANKNPENIIIVVHSVHGKGTVILVKLAIYWETLAVTTVVTTIRI